MNRLPHAGALLAAALLAACSGDDGAASRRPDVLIISIDTLRADHLGCYGYSPYREPVSPSIDSFAQEGLRFENCFTPRGQTAPSLCALMTGCYPSKHGVLDNDRFQFKPGVATLAEELAAAGYATHSFAARVPGAKGGKASRGFAEGGSAFDAYKLAPKEPQSRWDDAAEQACTRFLAAQKRDGKPFFAWVHFYDVHQPYAPPAPYDGMFAGDYRGPLRMKPGASEQEFTAIVQKHLNERMLARAPLDDADAKYVVALYDGGIRSTDARVGRILQTLRDAKLDESTIVIVTADHGEELGEHNAFWFHGNSVYDSVLHVPLLVRGPGVRKGRSAALVQNVDLLPTLLELAGAKPPNSIDGVSLASLLRSAADPATPLRAVAWSEWENLILGARTNEWKLIANPLGAHPRKPPYNEVPTDGGYFVDCFELYDLGHDAHEKFNLWKERKADVSELRDRVSEEYERFAARAIGVPDEITDPAERADLNQLGYGGDVVLDPCQDK